MWDDNHRTIGKIRIVAKAFIMVVGNKWLIGILVQSALQPVVANKSKYIK